MDVTDSASELNQASAPPAAPERPDCCGSGCAVCVLEAWHEAMEAWRRERDAWARGQASAWPQAAGSRQP